MIGRRTSIALASIAALLLAGCASPDPLEGRRTVFANPYAVPVIDRTGIGPRCDVSRGEDATCLGVPLTRRGRGNTIGAPLAGDLNRNQRRILRERAALLRQASQPAPAAPEPPPLPQPAPQPTLPTMESAAGAETP